MKLTKVLSGLSLFLTVVLVTGCSNTNVQNTSAAMPAIDGREDWPHEIVIVQMPDENNPDAGEMHDGFRKAIEEYLGITVKEMEGSEYAVGIEAMKSGNLDIMVVSPMSYYQAKMIADAEPLVTSGTMGVNVEYRTVFITRSDRDDINTIEDMRDKTFAFVDPASSSGYLYPKANLIGALGLDTDQLENPGYFFKTVAYSGKHDSSIMGVVNGDYDTAAVALQVIDQLAKAELINKDEIKIIGQTDIIPNACYVMRSTLPKSLKEAIKEFYLQYDDISYFETFYGSSDVRFVEALDSDYDVVDEMFKLLKMEE